SKGSMTKGSGSLSWPLASSGRITSTFGQRESPTAGASTNHKGVDIAVSSGTPIKAADGGTVVTATYSSSAGNYVVISHGNGTSTVYMHCQSLDVSAGDTVSKGETIAKVGSTGYSTGPHLHFGVLKNGQYVDPMDYVSQ
ncbi:MAG: M23 family metallopeptidase, partial [Clostridium sp.]|nr:M23 family metallopeptidase [Clostridium sp.]